MLKTTVEIIERADNNGCQLNLDEKAPGCLKKILSDVNEYKHRVQESQLIRYSSYFQSDFLFSDDTLTERFVAPIKYYLIDTKIYDSYKNCDEKIVQGLPQIKTEHDAVEWGEVPQSIGMTHPLYFK